MANNYLVGHAGEHYVAAALNQRGAYASPWAGNLPGIDIVAMSEDRSLRAYIQVKTKGPKHAGWQISIREGWILPSKFECASSGGCRNHPVVCSKKKHKHGSPHTNSIDLRGVDHRPWQPEHFWFFVALKEPPQAPEYWIISDKDVRDTIRKEHIGYLDENAGHRNEAHHSAHALLREQHLEPHFRKWKALDLGLEDDPPLP